MKLSVFGIIGETLKRLHGQWGLIGLAGLVFTAVSFVPLSLQIRIVLAERAYVLASNVDVAETYMNRLMEKNPKYSLLSDAVLEKYRGEIEEEERVFRAAEWREILADSDTKQLFSIACQRHSTDPLSDVGQRLARMWKFGGWLIYFFAYTAVLFGMSWMMLCAVRGEGVSLGNFWMWFQWRRLLKAGGAFFFIFLYTFLWGVLGGFLRDMVVRFCGAPDWLGQLIAWTVVLFFILPYAMTFFVLPDNPQLGIHASIRMSKRLMKRRRLVFLLVLMPVIVLMVVLIVCTCGIAIIWTGALATAAQAVFYDKLKAEYERKQAEVTA